MFAFFKARRSQLNHRLFASLGELGGAKGFELQLIGAFFLLIAISVAAAVLAVQIELRLHDRFGGWNASLLAAVLFLLVVAAIAHFLPEFSEVPASFPATLLWRFRVAALAMQALQWSAMGLLFGWLTERDFRSRNALHSTAL